MICPFDMDKAFLVHLLRHPHFKRGAADGQDITERTAGGLMKRKQAHRNVLSWGNCASVIENEQIDPSKMTGMRYKTEI